MPNWRRCCQRTLDVSHHNHHHIIVRPAGAGGSRSVLLAVAHPSHHPSAPPPHHTPADVAWVGAALGPRWGFAEGFLQWLSGTLDASLYPVLFLSYAEPLMAGTMGARGASDASSSPLVDPVTGRPATPAARLALGLAVAVLQWTSWRGLAVVGAASVGLAGLVLTPFVVLICLQLWSGFASDTLDPGRLVAAPPGGLASPDLQWGRALHVWFWCLSAWDSASTVAGEVRDAPRTYPRAFRRAGLAVALTYLLPTAATLLAASEPTDPGVWSPGPGGGASWSAGLWARAAQRWGGEWLAVTLISGAALSQCGQFLADASGDAWQLAGMADRGLLPAAFGRLGRHRTPTLAIAVTTALVLACNGLGFGELLVLVNGTKAAALVLQGAAFVVLRLRHPSAPRPFRVPVPDRLAAVALAPPALLLGLVVATDGAGALLFAVGGLVAGLALHECCEAARIRRWTTFANGGARPPSGLAEYLSLVGGG